MKKLCTCFFSFCPTLQDVSQQTGNKLKENGLSDVLQQIIVGKS